jgi:hypothetical protein
MADKTFAELMADAAKDVDDSPHLRNEAARGEYNDYMCGFSEAIEDSVNVIRPRYGSDRIYGDKHLDGAMALAAMCDASKCLDAARRNAESVQEGFTLVRACGYSARFIIDAFFTEVAKYYVLDEASGRITGRKEMA